MEHGGNEFDAGGLVGVLLFEVHDEAEGAVFEGRVRGADYYCVPGEVLVDDEGVIVDGRYGFTQHEAVMWGGGGGKEGHTRS